MQKTMLATALVILFCLPGINAQQQSAQLLLPGKEFPTINGARLEYNTSAIAGFPRQGKWTIIYFWSKRCSSCIASFPKLNALNLQYRDQLDFILVGKPEEGIEKLYQKYYAHYNLQLPVLYDSLLFTLVNIPYVPFVIIVDPAGKVNAITNSTLITQPVLDSMLSPHGYKFPMIANFAYKDFMNVTLEEIKKGKQDYYKYSELIPYTPGQLVRVSYFSERFNWSRYYKNGIIITPAGLTRLYQIAYLDTDVIMPEDSARYGKYWPKIIGEGIDSSFFDWDADYGRNLYSYALFINKAHLSNAELQKSMQLDLEQTFPYIAKIETRVMPCYLLQKTRPMKKALFAKVSDTSMLDWQHTGFTLRNQPISSAITAIWNYHQDEAPIFDLTGLHAAVTLKIDAVMTDLESINDALKEKGFELVKSSREMKVLVVRNATSVADRTSANKIRE